MSAFNINDYVITSNGLYGKVVSRTVPFANVKSVVVKFEDYSESAVPCKELTICKDKRPFKPDNNSSCNINAWQQSIVTPERERFDQKVSALDQIINNYNIKIIWQHTIIKDLFSQSQNYFFTSIYTDGTTFDQVFDKLHSVLDSDKKQVETIIYHIIYKQATDQMIADYKNLWKQLESDFYLSPPPEIVSCSFINEKSKQNIAVHSEYLLCLYQLYGEREYIIFQNVYTQMGNTILEFDDLITKQIRTLKHQLNQLNISRGKLLKYTPCPICNENIQNIIICNICLKVICSNCRSSIAFCPFCRSYSFDHS